MPIVTPLNWLSLTIVIICLWYWGISGGGGVADRLEFLKARNLNKRQSELIIERSLYVPL